ncbi:MAG TPA: methyltransferase domain-containing protein [Thermodesulfobacteriota bacterium]|nr:methyltransferase domain-containing protein [Thermodesulfobacteriota bacterium]
MTGEAALARRHPVPWQLRMFDKGLKKNLKLRAIAAMLDRPLEGTRNLDVCSGENTGGLSYHLRRLGGSWDSGDLERDNLPAMRELLDRVHALDPDRLPFADGTFDHVVLIDVLEHLDDEQPLLREVARVLKPNGRLIVTVPDHSQRLLGNRIRWRLGMTPAFYGHKRYGYDERDMAATLARGGFVVERFARYGKFVTEVIEMALNLAYLAKRRQKGMAHGPAALAPAGELTRNIAPVRGEELGAGFRLYEAVFPLLRALTALDRLPVGSPGYNVVARARKA